MNVKKIIYNALKINLIFEDIENFELIFVDFIASRIRYSISIIMIGADNVCS